MLHVDGSNFLGHGFQPSMHPLILLASVTYTAPPLVNDHLTFLPSMPVLEETIDSFCAVC
jgi:hypothetical protein